MRWNWPFSSTFGKWLCILYSDTCRGGDRAPLRSVCFHVVTQTQVFSLLHSLKSLQFGQLSLEMPDDFGTTLTLDD